MEHEIQLKVTQLVISGAIFWTGKKEDKVEFDIEEIEKYNFPEGTVFGGEIDLKKGVEYKKIMTL